MNDKIKIFFKNYSFFIIAFIEGSSVMAIELTGAKIIATFYGTTLYVWAAVLAVSLGGVTTGYFLGSNLSAKHPEKKGPIITLLVGALFVAIMPWAALQILPFTEGMEIRSGALLSAVLLIFLSLVCMGMVSALLIQLSNPDQKSTAKTEGSVKTISSGGVIVITLLMGFYLLPECRIHKSLFWVSALLVCMPVLLSFKHITPKLFSGFGIMFLFFIGARSLASFKSPEIDLQILYKSESVLGQVAVFNNPQSETKRMFRLQFINQIPQMQDNAAVLEVSGWVYPHRLATLASVKPKGSKALLIGRSCGNIAIEFKKMGFAMDNAEIDSRIPIVAKDYFGFDPAGMNIQGESEPLIRI